MRLKGDYVMSRVDLKVEGMNCGSCVTHINAALHSVAGINEIAVDLKSNQVTVIGRMDTAAVIGVLRDAGYPAHVATPDINAGTKTASSVGSGCCCH